MPVSQFHPCLIFVVIIGACLKVNKTFYNYNLLSKKARVCISQSLMSQSDICGQEQDLTGKMQSCHKTFYNCNSCCKKLECFSVNHLHPCLIFVVIIGACLKVNKTFIVKNSFGFTILLFTVPMLLTRHKVKY